jgi:hypothetical protein
MSSVFLSYAREDLDYVEELESALVAENIQVWRDETNIYGRERWPKAIGEAIAEQDFVVLVWSKKASDSHFVEFEWTTAIALKKVIVPCLTDETPLPDVLKSIHGILARNLEETFPSIKESLQGTVKSKDTHRMGKVIAELEKVPSNEPETAVQALKTFINQQGWAVEGNVYQAGGDIIVQVPPERPEKSKSLVEQWQAWVVFFVALLTVLTMLLDLPAKVVVFFANIGLTQVEGPVEVMLPLSGVVWDETHEPLAGVEMVLPEFNVTVVTDRNGRYAFEVEVAEERPVNLIARKDGYVTRDMDPTLGNNSLNFVMRKGAK